MGSKAKIILLVVFCIIAVEAAVFIPALMVHSKLTYVIGMMDDNYDALDNQYIRLSHKYEVLQKELEQERNLLRENR